MLSTLRQFLCYFCLYRFRLPFSLKQGIKSRSLEQRYNTSSSIAARSWNERTRHQSHWQHLGPSHSARIHHMLIDINWFLKTLDMSCLFDPFLKQLNPQNCGYCIWFVTPEVHRFRYVCEQLSQQRLHKLPSSYWKHTYWSQGQCIYRHVGLVLLKLFLQTLVLAVVLTHT